MGKMIVIRQLLVNTLKTYCANAYYRKAKKNAQYPRVTFSVDVYQDHAGRLLIDVWDAGDDTDRIEDLSDSIIEGLSNKVYASGAVKFCLYHSRRLPLDDEDLRLNRIQLQFDVRIY